MPRKPTKRPVGKYERVKIGTALQGRKCLALPPAIINELFKQWRRIA